MKTIAYVTIPSSYRVGGQELVVNHVDRCDGNVVGLCNLCEGRIEIAEFFNKDDRQSESSKRQTFWHEMTHSILDTMGEFNLSHNEKFVSCFSGFLADAMEKAVFIEEQPK